MLEHTHTYILLVIQEIGWLAWTHILSATMEDYGYCISRAWQDDLKINSDLNKFEIGFALRITECVHSFLE